jgi:type IV pilus assembly protein PilY1
MKKIGFIVFFTTLILSSTIQLHADDTDLFTAQIPPDALILLDMSGSMNWDPAGNPASYPNRRIDIARKVLNTFLDDNKDGNINTADESSLNIRLGYMRYKNSNDNDDNEPTTGSIRVLSTIGSSYQDIWTKITDPAETDPGGGTPLAASLAEAKIHFLRDVNPVDPSIACRKKFVILITDGADTFGCGGNGVDPNNCSDETQNPGMYRRRMQTVQKAKELAEAGIKVFVVGFGGSAPDCLKRTLNWAAFYGGTDNPTESNAGDTKAYNIANYGDPCSTTDTNADPANYSLSGYAFLAEDASQLTNALKAIFKYIQGCYSFASPTVPSVRVVDNDIMYISSFRPKNDSPFWEGYLKAYQLNTDGTLPVDENKNPINSPIWDAFLTLNAMAPNSRNINTYVNNIFKSFLYDNLTNADLDVTSDLDRQNLINHIRGIDAYDIDQDLNTTEERDWKLGDIFHSNAVVVGSPSRFFEDAGFSGTGGFYEANKDRTKVVIVGANDGMLHAFNAATGVEEWAFIPNALLKNLKLMSSNHTYYVDSTPKVADVWFYSDPTDTTKSVDEWRTVLICGLRKGGNSYFALDITDTLSPQYLWEFPKPADTATIAKMGQSWSEPAIGRVNVEVGGELYERWVAFMGGGFDSSSNLGRAFFVIDVKTGEIIWEFSYDGGHEQKKYMTHSLTASPTAVDTNGDGYIDKVYIGDLGGQMWVFDVSFNAKDKKSNSQWAGKRLFKAPGINPEKHPIYYQPAVPFDRYRNPWVYFGTGDREHPKDTSNPAERFYAIKDDGLGNYPRTETDLKDVTTLNTFTQDPTKKGWYIQLEKSGQKLEKVLAKPSVFNQLVYFTTYTYTNISDPCSAAGEAKLYVVEYLSGGGALGVDELSDLKGTADQRAQPIGAGIPSTPVITVNLKGKASIVIGTTSGQVFSQKAFSPTTNKELLYWREVIP